MGVWDLVILGLLAVWLSVAVFLMYRRKKRGGCIGCQGKCGGCSGRDGGGTKCKKHPVSRL